MAPLTTPKSEAPTAAVDAELSAILESVLQFARQRDYTGWDYADGMSSRVLQRLGVENKWVNLIVQESIKRFPVNIRPVLLVEQRQNFKGSALFALANLTAADLLDEPRYTREARALLDWLVANQARGYASFCGGHQHALQELNDMKTPGTPGIVSTAYAMFALMQGAELDDRYRQIAATGVHYILEDLSFREIETGARIKYKPDDDESAFVLNANAIAARTLLEVDDMLSRSRHRSKAEQLLDYVVTNQTTRGGWKYMDPPSASHLSMDNHHNGFIVESLLRHRDLTGSTRYADELESGLEFYRNQLFEATGAPNWDESKSYPRDIHAAAQGIIVFCRSGNIDFARQILEWTLTHLYAGDGRFYYQKRRFYTKRFTLMRWCQAWMAYAIAFYLRTVRELPPST